mgnify:CR=1 FL=1
MSFYTSLTGLNAATTELSVTSNNIANAGTSGFKRSEADFGDIFATSPLQKASAVVGRGVSLKEVSQEFSQGNIEFSANSLDIAITGDGFFPLESSDGTAIFTRNGGFSLNEQNQMVNAAGQALQALPVDSTNKADFGEPLRALTIPRVTVSEFRATTEVELGLNLPSEVAPIEAAFNPAKPETYHKTTSLTVFGASGSAHLATIFYVKTADATADVPFNKYQTYVYIDDTFIEPNLIQASDAGGDLFYVNKYGDVKTQSELAELQRTEENSEEFLITKGTLYKKYAFDNLSTPINSIPATLDFNIPATSSFLDDLNLTNNSSGVDFSKFARADLANLFSISVDGSTSVSIGLEHLAGSTTPLSGTGIAFELTNAINQRFGDGKKFDFSSASNQDLVITRPLQSGGFESLRLNINEIMQNNPTLLESDGQIQPEPLAFLLSNHLDTVSNPSATTINSASSINTGNNTVTISGHGFKVGDELFYQNGNTVHADVSTGEVAVGVGAEGITSATDFINHAGHGLANGDRIWYDANGGTAINGLTDGAYYFVVSADSNKFKLSATSNGNAINITAATTVETNHRYVKAPANNSIGGINPNRSYYVKSVNGDAITLAATQGGATLNLTAASNGTNHNFQLKQPDFSDIEITYDMANQAFRFTQTSESKVNKLYISTGDQSGVNNAVLGVGQADFTNNGFGTLLSPLDQDDSVTLLSNVLPNGSVLRQANDQRAGIAVTYAAGQFSFKSGTTGDGSSLQIETPSTNGVELLGMNSDSPSFEVKPQVSLVNNLPAVRGKASSPAVVNGDPMGVDPSRSFEVTQDNKTLTVIVDGISAQIELTQGSYSIGTFTQHLEDKVNLMADSLGRTVSGVEVGFNESGEFLTFTGSTTNDTSFIQVAGHSDWGLENVEAGFGQTSTYIALEADMQGNSMVYVSQDVDGNWNETLDKGDFDEDNVPFWTPIFLDKGELTFDTSGTLVSPVGVASLKSATVTGETIGINYANSTQFNSPFAVLNSSQNGAPEGDLVGLTINDDGLVVASYSNGSQSSLGKIILANFATPKGLRQMGDSSFFETSESGVATFGEPGSAGFGTIRAGAMERSNVDLTAELVDLITAQRNFQANAKAIETSSSLTQTIINIRG